MSMTRQDTLQVTEASRRGAHRPRGNPLMGLLPVVAVIAVVGLVAGLGYVLFGRGGDATGDPTAVIASPSSDQASPAASSSAGTPSASGSPAVVASPSASASSSSSASPSAEPSDAGTVDTSTVLDFYNGSSPNVPGLSRTAANRVKAQGWSIGVIQNWDGAAVDQTTVFYAKPSQLATAKAVIEELGVGTAELSSQYGSNGLTVVISNDYAN